MARPDLLRGVAYCRDCHWTGRPRHDYVGPTVDGFCRCPVGAYVRNRLAATGGIVLTSIQTGDIKKP